MNCESRIELKSQFPDDFRIDNSFFLVNRFISKVVVRLAGHFISINLFISSPLSLSFCFVKQDILIHPVLVAHGILQPLYPISRDLRYVMNRFSESRFIFGIGKWILNRHFTFFGESCRLYSALLLITLHSLLSAVPGLQLLMAVPSLSSNFCRYRSEQTQPLRGRHGRSRQPTTALAHLGWRSFDTAGWGVAESSRSNMSKCSRGVREHVRDAEIRTVMVRADVIISSNYSHLPELKTWTSVRQVNVRSAVFRRSGRTHNFLEKTSIHNNKKFTPSLCSLIFETSVKSNWNCWRSCRT